ncbi:MAG: DNA recombination protein RmuC [Rhodospirillaceae bacterium]|nr:DNA recombination protein RmuC [Rhodospirillaceae bacterium]
MTNSEVLLSVLLVVSILSLIAVAYLIFRPPTALSEKLRRALEEDLRKGREEAGAGARSLREEVTSSLASLGKNLTESAKSQQEQLTGLADSNAKALDRVRTTVDERVKELQQENVKKLDEMRKTVDEKLQSTLETRLGEAFKMVSTQLETVSKGLGEMKSLAQDVGQLQQVLTNVKTRGTFAEVQLGSILEEFLAPGQFDENIATKKGSNARVEYAVRFPGPSEDSHVWFPIDAKFPLEDYQRLQEAAARGDVKAAKQAADALASRLKAEAKKIKDKYLDPPNTTEFAMMYLATEGLYAEALRQPGLAETIRAESRVVIAGPTNTAAMLSSFRMGFKTLAIEKRSSEVWEVLSAVKTEFGKFGEVLQRLEKQLGTASNTIKQAKTRTNVMSKKLAGVEKMPETESSRLLSGSLGDDLGIDDDEEEEFEVDEF